MYGLIGNMTAVPGQRDELIRVLLDATSSLPGCLSYVVAADPAAEDVVWVTEVWESRAAHEASLLEPAVRAAIAAGRPLIREFGPRTVTAPLGGHGLYDGRTRPQSLRDPVAPVKDRIVDISAVIGLPMEDAFRYFTEPPLLERWLAPKAVVEKVVGGRYELFWEPDDPENNSTIGCRITALDPPRCVAFQWRSPEQFKPFANGADPLTHVVIMFHPAAVDGTRVRLVQSGWRSDPEWEAARAWQERAWQVAFQALGRATSTGSGR